jgi:archaellin
MPACGSWDFETASSEGWALYDEAYHTASNGPIAPTNQLAVLNAQSLAIPFKTTGPNGGDVAVKVRLCNGGQAVDLSNSVIFARVHTAPTTTCYPTGAGEGFVEFYNGSTLLYAGADFTVNCDSGWYSFQAPVGYPAVTEIGFVLRVFSQWEGTYYLDDIRIE